VSSIHRASFSNFTHVLESIHTCQGRGHSPTKRRVETSAVRSATTHKTAHQSQYSVHDSLLQLLKTNCMISTSTVFQVRFWRSFCMWSCVQTHRHKPVTVESQTTVNYQESPVYQDHSLTGRVQEPSSIHRSSFTHFTLVLESIHTCQGRENSRPKRRVETSAIRSTPTHKTAHQSQYSVHDSLLQLLKTNCMISSSTVFQVRFW
jgi:organic hydroperoxide reductase OsmC/OhrA